MPPKKSTKAKGQKTLVTFMTNDPSEMSQATLEKKLEKQSEKLLKIRRQIEQRRIEEHKLMKNILKLQITDLSRHQETAIQEKEQFWIMTVSNVLESNSSLLKIILGDYGQVIVDKPKPVEPTKEKEEQKIVSEETQWREKGQLNPSYLQQYSPDFINTLKEYQYLANSMEHHD